MGPMSAATVHSGGFLISTRTFLLAFAFVTASSAQVTTGRLEGTVSDSQAAAVPGADVKVVNVQTGQAFNVVTDERGYWALPSMSTANYKVTVTRQGFKTATLENVKVDAGVPA